MEWNGEGPAPSAREGGLHLDICAGARVPSYATVAMGPVCQYLTRAGL